MTNVIFHKLVVEGLLSPEARGVERIINEVLVSDPSAIDWGAEKPNVTVADLFNPGDVVVLYGAFKGACLLEAQEALERKGVKVSYHPEGCL